jgi:hypothetical protein
LVHPCGMALPGVQDLTEGYIGFKHLFRMASQGYRYLHIFSEENSFCTPPYQVQAICAFMRSFNDPAIAAAIFSRFATVAIAASRVSLSMKYPFDSSASAEK